MEEGNMIIATREQAHKFGMDQFQNGFQRAMLLVIEQCDDMIKHTDEHPDAQQAMQAMRTWAEMYRLEMAVQS